MAGSGLVPAPLGLLRRPARLRGTGRLARLLHPGFLGRLFAGRPVDGLAVLPGLLARRTPIIRATRLLPFRLAAGIGLAVAIGWLAAAAAPDVRRRRQTGNPDPILQLATLADSLHEGVRVIGGNLHISLFGLHLDRADFRLGDLADAAQHRNDPARLGVLAA